MTTALQQRFPKAWNLFQMLVSPRLDEAFQHAEEKWEENIKRLEGHKVSYLLMGEAAPSPSPKDPMNYFYGNCKGAWCTSVKNALLPGRDKIKEPKEIFDALAELGFVLVDSLPFAIRYTSTMRLGEPYLDLLRGTRHWVEEKLARIPWADDVKVALAFRLNGEALCKAYENKLRISEDRFIDISPEKIVTNASNMGVDARRLREAFAMPIPPKTQ